MERTLIILKPDAFDRRKVGATIDRFEQAGFAVIAAKMVNLSKEKVSDHYSHIADKPFYPAIEDFMRSRPVLVLILAGEGVISRVRNLSGPTDSAAAPAGTIRGDWGTDKMKNIIHASDSWEAADLEIKRFFEPEEILG